VVLESGCFLKLSEVIFGIWRKSDEDNVCSAELLDQLVQLGDFNAAWGAGDKPEIKNDNLAFQVSQSKVRSTERPYVKARCRFTDLL
jgi:hypothetical protein